MRKGVQVPSFIPEAYIIDELDRGRLKEQGEEMEVVYPYPMDEDPQPKNKEKEKERVIIIEL